MIKLTWKELCERFADGEVFAIENDDGLNSVVFISRTEVYWDGPRHQDTATVIDWGYEVKLVDWFEAEYNHIPSYVFSYENTECSTNSRCSCVKCLEYDKLYGT